MKRLLNMLNGTLLTLKNKDMEDLLKNFIIQVYKYPHVDIDHYIIDGANCTVNFYTDDGRYYRETVNINVWEMIGFLNSKNV